MRCWSQLEVNMRALAANLPNHCCTFRKVAPTITGWSRLLVGDEIQQTADCHTKVCSPANRAPLQASSHQMMQELDG
jgi:hypothetical protein